MKKFFKCTLSALAVSAVVVLALLSGGCNKTSEKPSSDSLIGTWLCEFYEEELGGPGRIEFEFKENGELEVILFCDGDRFTVPMLWHTDDDKLYFLDTDEKEIYEESDIEWPYVKYKVSDKTLDFYDEDGEVVSYGKIR